jgi:hypothetical protein
MVNHSVLDGVSIRKYGEVRFFECAPLHRAHSKKRLSIISGGILIGFWEGETQGRSRSSEIPGSLPGLLSIPDHPWPRGQLCRSGNPPQDRPDRIENNSQDRLRDHPGLARLQSPSREEGPGCPNKDRGSGSQERVGDCAVCSSYIKRYKKTTAYKAMVLHLLPDSREISFRLDDCPPR